MAGNLNKSGEPKALASGSSTAESDVREIGNTRLTLRADLVFSPRTEDADVHYMIEDPVSSKFFRVGVTEYAFISLLDGTLTLHDALAELSSAMPNHGISEHDAIAICKWLVEMKLATTTKSVDTDELTKQSTQAEQRRMAERLNPLMIKMPLGNPNRFFENIAPLVGWLHTPLAMIAAIGLIGYGGYLVASDWARFEEASRGIFAPSNWLWLAIGWVILKIIHETSHGIACKKYGGGVREWGLIFILFAPLAYVDVTSSWRFQSRWQRIHVAVAGMYIELILAAVAAIVWSNSSPGIVSYVCYNLIIMASISTIVFNANPLMRFDGYYILSDLLGITNLYTNGQQVLRHWSRRLLLALPSTLPAWSTSRRWTIASYGIAAFVWRWFVCASLVISAIALFDGVGILLSILAVILWIGLPAIRFVSYLMFGKPGERPNRFRFAWTTGSLATIATLVLVYLPWPGTMQAPAVVQFTPPNVVRAASPGFVQKILVRNGQLVRKGALLIVLQNDDLRQKQADLELSIKQSQIQSRVHEQNSDLALQQAEDKQRDALVKQLRETTEQVDGLTIRATADGRVVARELPMLLGKYINTGGEIATLGNDDSKELRASIAQEDFDAFRALVNESLHVRAAGQAFDATLIEVNPRASKSIPHQALSSANDGPLAVHQKETAKENDQLEFLAPRFAARLETTSEFNKSLFVGQVCTVAIRPCDESIGVHLYHRTSNWIRTTFDRHFRS